MVGRSNVNGNPNKSASQQLPMTISSPRKSPESVAPKCKGFIISTSHNGGSSTLCKEGKEGLNTTSNVTTTATTDSSKKKVKVTSRFDKNQPSSDDEDRLLKSPTPSVDGHLSSEDDDDAIGVTHPLNMKGVVKRTSK